MSLGSDITTNPSSGRPALFIECMAACSLFLACSYSDSVSSMQLVSHLALTPISRRRPSGCVDSRSHHMPCCLATSFYERIFFIW